jgi:hypothetical protein
VDIFNLKTFYHARVFQIPRGIAHPPRR